MTNKSLNAAPEVIVTCEIHLLVKVISIAVVYFLGIRLTTGLLDGGLLVIWVILVINVSNVTIFPATIGFAETGIVVEKFRRRVFIPWEDITEVTRNGGNTKIYGNGKNLTRYERLITNTIGISVLCTHYEEADRYIREKVGDKYKWASTLVQSHWDKL